ncbi:light-harvesting protein [Parasphingorhabdus sp. DH2-15]|jgi:light-harvesting complex 1 beta chain|uniref:light-harvesting protein n=1 Tax=Parasphingorhabdus sp. DH2-15 TaxID=3444112 RepID=UPI003F68966D
MSDSNERFGPETYMTPEEAKEFHKGFFLYTGLFVATAVVAHALVWAWHPWFPDRPGYAMVNDAVQVASTAITSLVA